MHYDVVGVVIESLKVRWVMPNFDLYAEAEAAMNMGVLRQGVEDRFFAITEAGKYKAGDRWDGAGFVEAPAKEPEARIKKIGDMWYPIGPRGL